MGLFSFLFGGGGSSSSSCPLTGQQQPDDCTLDEEESCPHWDGCQEAAEWHRMAEEQEEARKKSDENTPLDDIPF